MSDAHGGHGDHGDQGAQETGNDHPPGHTMGTHGMVALGTRDVYLTHLAMRSGPHMFQVLIRAHFEPGATSTVSDRSLAAAGTTDFTDIYREDRVHADNPFDIYTVFPTSKFELADLAAGRIDRFSADVIRGHAERDSNSVVLLGRATVVVDALIHAHELYVPPRGEASPRASGSVPHMLFGSGDEFFVCHRVSLHGTEEQPSDCGYHQIFPLTTESARSLGFERRDGVVDITTEVSNLDANGQLSASGGSMPFDLSALLSLDGGAVATSLELEREHYLEVLA